MRFYALLVSLAVYTWFLPPLERTSQWQWDWVAEVLLRNYVIVIIVAGRLYLWLFTFQRQGESSHYGTRP